MRLNGMIPFSSNLPLVCRGARHCSSVKPHLLVFQKAKYLFKNRSQFFLVVFMGGAFAKSIPLLLVCQISQISVVSAGVSSPVILLTLS